MLARVWSNTSCLSNLHYCCQAQCS